MAKAASQALEPLIHCSELEDILGHRRLAKVPRFLRRNLSYAQTGRTALQAGTGHGLHLQLYVAGAGVAQAGPGLEASGRAGSSCRWDHICNSNSSGSTDVVIAALCVATHSSEGYEVFVPVAARAVPVRSEPPSTPLSVQLPLVPPQQATYPAAGLALVLIHQRSTQLATLVSLACRSRRASASQSAGTSSSAATGQPSSSSRRSSSCSSGCKVLSPTVTATTAFQFLPNKSAVTYSILNLGTLPGDGSKLEFPLALLEGVLTTHEPPSAGASGHSVAAPVPFPYIQFTAGLSPSDTAISHATSSSGGASNRLQFRCSVSYRPDTAVIVGQESQQHGQPAQGQQQEHPKTKRQRRQHEQLQLLRLQGPEPPVTFFFCSHDGACSVRATALGFCCPFPSCRGLRCWGWAALQQHMTASHSYLSCYFPDLVPGRQLEVFVRCQPAWCDPLHGFLPRQLVAAAALNTHPLLHLMVQPHVSHPFIYTCPAACRHLRRGGFGRCPAAEEEQLLEQAAEDAADEQEAEGDSDGWDEEDGSSRGLLNTSSLAAAAGRARGSGTGRQPAANRRKAAAAATGAAAAAQGASGGGRGRGHGGRGGRGKVGAKKRGGRGKASAQEQIQQVEQQLGGLSLHNSKGRVKYYHSLTCVALTQQELFELGGGDPESKADVAEWQSKCRERLQEQASLCPEERRFMFEWNSFLRSNPLHADADVPAAVSRFVVQHGDELTQDGPLRRCLVAYLLNLWRFRLLTPSQLHELLGGLPPIACSRAAPC
ncbi:hypothetical protein D9Q98_008750 [Chlorella vulgaris]|uniref:Polycomb protein VEFS-Box domain-containing protein n=1 Tax=Chlorella vulgaris TaxID=3077 RepID=A0A9D4TIJ2_CHLVU|nr:hypothetical protein D9Q98_008750 [Chlorella vulgaris]